MLFSKILRLFGLKLSSSNAKIAKAKEGTQTMAKFMECAMKSFDCSFKKNE